MAGELINVEGSFATVQASSAVADGAFSAGTRTTITTALGATESTYPILDFKLDITSGTPTENGVVHIYRRSSDGTDESPAPAGSYLQEYVGTITLDNTTDEYYLYGVNNPAPDSTYYWFNDDGAVTLTAALSARGRSYKTA